MCRCILLLILYKSWIEYLPLVQGCLRIFIRVVLTNSWDSSVILCICFSLFQMCHPINWSAGSWSEKNNTILTTFDKERDQLMSPFLVFIVFIPLNNLIKLYTFF